MEDIFEFFYFNADLRKSGEIVLTSIGPQSNKY